MAQCKRCGSTEVEWQQNKAGRWYLADRFYGARGSTWTLPHFKSCKAVNAERAEQIAREQAARNAVRAEYMRWDGHRYIDTRTGDEWTD